MGDYYSDIIEYQIPKSEVAIIQQEIPDWLKDFLEEDDPLI